MPLFGSNPSAPPLMGGGTPTSAVADATGATASSPFLQYMQRNAGNAKTTAQALLGPKPEPDYRAALLQAGLGILGAPTGQAPLQSIAQGAQTALPLYMREKERMEGYDDKVNQLAMQLGLKDADLAAKLKERKGMTEMGGYIIDADRLNRNLAQGMDSKTAFDDSVVIESRGATEKNADALAEQRVRVQQLRSRPGVDQEELARAEAKLEGLEWQLRPQDPSSSSTFGYMAEDGTFTTYTGDPANIPKVIANIGDAKAADKMRTQQKATDRTLQYSSRILDILDEAEVASAGRLGGMASSLSAWSKGIESMLSGDAKKQYTAAKDDPLKHLRMLRNDPEAENWLDDDTYSRLEEIGSTNKQLLSNIIGLGYATARASDEGGRLSNSDVAFALNRVGWDMDALLNDPAAVRKGVLELARDNIQSWESTLELSGPEGRKMVENDILLNKRLKDYGFTWTGGPKGELMYGQQDGAQTTSTPGERTAVKPTQAPQASTATVPVSQMSLQQLQQMDRTQMTEQELQEAARRYNELTSQ